MSETNKKEELRDMGSAILLEDAHASRQIVKFILTKNRFQVHDFANGKLALDQLDSQMPENVKVIFVDVMMPVMDGFEFLQNLKVKNIFQNIPIIFITAMSDKEVVMKARQMGASGYILKPVTSKKLIEVLNKLFPNEEFQEI